MTKPARPMPSAVLEVPSAPAMPAEGVARLARALEGADCFLEYGAGGSTRLAASMKVPHIYSVESDKAFAAAVARAVAAEGARSVLHSIVADIGPTGPLGRPVDRSHMHNWPDYAVAVWRNLKADGRTPDVVLIDGRFRVACFLASAMNLPAGAAILFDDYEGRSRYHVVERHMPLAAMEGRMAVFEVPKNLDYPAMAMDLAHYAVDYG